MGSEFSDGMVGTFDFEQEKAPIIRQLIIRGYIKNLVCEIIFIIAPL
jgi:hypothetical protein